jgi:hypothetical protein
VTGGSGGSGVVIIRQDVLAAAAITTGSPTVTDVGLYKIYVFNSSGTIGWA